MIAVLVAFAYVAEAARPRLFVTNDNAGTVVTKERSVKRTVVIEDEEVPLARAPQRITIFDEDVPLAPSAFVRMYRQPRVWLPGRAWSAPCTTCVPQASTSVYQVTEEPQKPWVNRGVLRDRMVIPKRPVVTVERVR